jgi:hypothetical protein
MHVGLHVSIRFSCHILTKFEFLDRFSKNTQNVMKIRSVGAESFHVDGRTKRRNADRRTDMTKLIVAFRQFWEAA